MRVSARRFFGRRRERERRRRKGRSQRGRVEEGEEDTCISLPHPLLIEDPWLPTLTDTLTLTETSRASEGRAAHRVRILFRLLGWVIEIGFREK